jgi:hypothetical protein
MIYLSLDDGTPITVNPFHVFVIEPLGDKGCRLIASGGATYEVAESMLQVAKAIKRWTKNEAE